MELRYLVLERRRTPTLEEIRLVNPNGRLHTEFEGAWKVICTDESSCDGWNAWGAGFELAIAHLEEQGYKRVFLNKLLQKLPLP